MYQVFRNNLGQVDAINNKDGVSLPYDPITKTFDENSYLVMDLRDWEQLHGALDLSDRPIEPQSLELIKQIKQQEIIDLAKLEQNALVADYAPPEQASWDRKIVEAKKFLVSNDLQDAPTLKIEAVVFAEAETEAEALVATKALAGAILAKSEQLYQASAQIAGKRARLWNQIEFAQSMEEVENIVWS